MSVAIDQFHMPKYQELPDVGLYLEQTAKYINGYLEPLGCMEITTSMISNYVKKGYVASPVRKQYYRKQIAQLFFIAMAKNVLSMENIGKLFALQEKTYATQVAFDYFCQELESMLYVIFGLREPSSQDGSLANSPKKMLHSCVIAIANIIYLSHQFEEIENYMAFEACEKNN
ncbi:MAG: DUF1836 domain-containing protein [bacterium]|nr:DUF1836 domain-containing protein [bacterium]MCM1373910.1 DUF1836 domain-containing protein [Muribaculum sp.]